MRSFKTKLAPFSRAFLSCESESKGKKIAAGLLGAAKKMPIWMDETGLCAVSFWQSEASMSFSDNLAFYDDRIDQMISENPEDRDDLLYIKEEMPKYANHRDIFQKKIPAEYRIHCDEDHLWGGTWMGHAVPDFAGICRNGTDYYRGLAEKYRTQNPGNDDFYDSIVMTMDAIDVFGRRFGELAAELLKKSTDAAEQDRLSRIVRTFDHAPKLPCLDFAEAVLVFVLVFSLDGIDSPGHFDQYMYPFWENTAEDLRMTYLDALWQFFHKTRTWNLCISGSDENGKDLTNSLSYAILKLTETYHYPEPNLTMRCHAGTPKALMEAAYRCIATGCGLPALYNDAVVCPALISMGIPKEDAHRYVMNGCNQIDIQSKSHMGLEDGEVCIAKAVELALHNGASGKTGVLLGPKTGEPEDFETFDDFYRAVLKQMEHLADIAAGLANLSQQVMAKHAPNPLRSALIEGCMEKARDYKNGGPLYGDGQILIEGIAETADSLAAIKKYVYEEKRFTLRQLADMLKQNFEGNEDTYYFLRNSELKYGNDIPYVDTLAGETVNHFNQYLRTIKTFRGGHYSGGCSPFVRSQRYGRSLGALPNGRKIAEPLLADSIGATPGRDVNGPTALINSCLNIDQTLPASGFILNLKFDAKLFRTKAGMDAFLALWDSYFSRGGQQLQIGVVSAEDLMKAQQNPDAYRDLIVRVGGYSDHFVYLDKDLQDNIIARTMY